MEDMSLSSAQLELDKVAPFLIKLFEIVTSPASDNLVCWSDHGESFRIVDRQKFAQDVLPLYFKHDNLRSFIRQLNIYGFQRVPNASGRDRTMEFQHAMFTRNGVRQLKEIKRGNQPKKTETEDVGEEESAHQGQGSGGETSQPPAKKQRQQDYAGFKSDVARLQKHLDEFEQDLKEHSMQVQLKLACILTALDDAPPMPNSLPNAMPPNALPNNAMPSALHNAMPHVSEAPPVSQPTLLSTLG